MREKRIYLVGFMGAGKSRVGNELAAQLGWEFADLDAAIESSEGMAVQEIFARHGEFRFRELEREHLARLSTSVHTVVALGGGAYIDPENRRLADSTGITIWLKVSFANVAHRVTMDGSRPLFADLERARRLYEERLPTYGLAKIHITTDDREPEDVLHEIVGEIAGRVDTQFKKI